MRTRKHRRVKGATGGNAEGLAKWYAQSLMRQSEVRDELNTLDDLTAMMYKSVNDVFPEALQEIASMKNIYDNDQGKNIMNDVSENTGRLLVSLNELKKFAKEVINAYTDMPQQSPMATNNYKRIKQLDDDVLARILDYHKAEIVGDRDGKLYIRTRRVPDMQMFVEDLDNSSYEYEEDNRSGLLVVTKSLRLLAKTKMTNKTKRYLYR